MYKLRIAVTILLLGALLFAIYWPGLHGGFFFDDGPSILQAEGIRIESLTAESLRQVFESGHAGPSGRPLAQLSFALNYYFSGFAPFAFKATNLAIHFVNGILVLFLAYRLFGAGRPQAERRGAAVAACIVAALWLLHPIQLLPVLHVVQRMTSLSALFLFAAMLLHIVGRERGNRAGMLHLAIAWGMLWPLAFFSKENGALFPLFALAWELTLRRSAFGNLDRFARGLVVISGLGFVVVAIYVFTPSMRWLWAGYELRAFSVAERLLTEGRVLWFYLTLILFPRPAALGLYHDDIAISTSLLSPWTTLPAIAGVVGIIWLTWWARRRAPLVSFGLAWFLIGHLMESTVLPLEIAHEHRNYVPIFGILLAAVAAANEALQRVAKPKVVAAVLVSGVLAYFSLVTALRSQEFGNDGLRTQIEVLHHAESARAQQEAGSFLAGLPDSASAASQIYASARAHFDRANELDPDSKLGWVGLIYLSCKAGIAPSRGDVSELARRLHETPFAPSDRTVLFDLKEMSIAGAICLSRSDMESLFSSALSNSTASPSVRAMLYSWDADYLMLRERDLPAAKAALAKSLQLAPENPSNRLKWAQLVFLEGHRDEAAQLLRALQDAPLSASERRTCARLLTCLHPGGNQCGGM